MHPLRASRNQNESIPDNFKQDISQTDYENRQRQKTEEVTLM